MQLEEAIRGRRSVGKVKPDDVDKAMIEKLLEAATWAPSHHCTEPWRFIVMTGEGRKRLGRAYAEIAKESLNGDPDDPANRELLRKQEAKAFRAPVVIAVAAIPSTAPNVERIEELAAAHAAVQNMLLTAHALGLGAIWRSGSAMYHPIMKRAFELEDKDALVGLVYVGYPQDEPKGKAARVPYAEKTVWIEQDK